MAKNKNHNLFKRGNTWYFRRRVRDKRTKKDRWIKEALSQSLTEARRLRDQKLKEILIYGKIKKFQDREEGGPLFGELAQKWAKITKARVKSSTYRGYQIAMNAYVLKRFGNTPIKKISWLEVEDFITDLECSAKRINNLLVPMRGVFKMAHKAGFVDQNIMALVENRKIQKPQIKPLAMEEVDVLLECLNPFYKPFFIVAFFTGMRAGEMSALKWSNVDFNRRLIKIVETRVYGEEGRPKTTSSYRDIAMLPMVYDALREQARRTHLHSKYVFLNEGGTPIEIETLRKNSWSKALKKAGLEYRPVIQTRHTFATMMISAGENLGWVQKMMGHTSLKMITDKYFSYVPNMTHNDGSKFMEEYCKAGEKRDPNVTQAQR